MKPERLQKILAQSGIASRRAAEKMIEDGRVRVNGRVVKELGAKADPRKDRIDVDDKRIVAEKKIYVVFHKPRGVVSTMSDPEGRPTVKDYLEKTGSRVVPVGRLDFATSGVLLATNDGDFAYALLHPKQKVPKTYVLKTSGEMKEADLEHWRGGIELDDGITQPAEVSLIRHENGKTWLELTITEGRNQMIRRMGEKTGFPVMRLARTSFAGITSECLPPGKWRLATRDELVALKKKYGVPKSIPSQLVEMQQPTARRFAKKSPSRDPREERGDRGRRSPAARSANWTTDEPPREPYGLGRGGRSRTTGSGGGVGAEGGGDYRLRRTRRGQ
ncbi:MAG: pseudouridine synthase [Polyangiaceae bacterium]